MRRFELRAARRPDVKRSRMMVSLVTLLWRFDVRPRQQHPPAPRRPVPIGRHGELCAQRPAIYGPAFRSDWRPMSEMHQFASAQDAGEEDSLQLRDRGSVPPSLREKDRSLQRRQDEVADFLALEVLRKLAGPDRRLQAGRERVPEARRRSRPSGAGWVCYLQLARRRRFRRGIRFPHPIVPGMLGWRRCRLQAA